MKQLFLLIIGVMTSFSAIYAQSLTGHVVDTDMNSISFANVILLKDSTFIDGVITDENGDFFIEHTSVLPSSIKISMMGYEDFISSIPSSGNLGTIILKESATLLDEVIVKSSLPRTKVSGSSMITSVANSTMSTLGTANDVLSKIPLVTCVDGKFNVFGRGEAVIYINGKVINDPAQLNQLSSLDIKSVEVISNPGAKYSSETNAVIKIKTISPQGEGFSASLFNSTRIAYYAISTDNILLKYRNKNVEIFANGYFYGGKRKFNDISSMTTYGHDICLQNFNANTIVSSSIGYGKIGFDYQPGTNHSFGAYYEGGISKSNAKGPINSDIILNNQLYESFKQYHSGSELTKPSHEANVYYNGTIGNLSIDFNADFLKTIKHKDDIQNEINHNNGDNRILLNALNKNELFAEKLVISYPLWKGSVEIGEEYTNSTIKYISNYSGVDISDGNIKVMENNFAGFAQASQSFGNINIGFGLRFEYGDYQYYDGAKYNSELSRTFCNLYPSFLLSTKIKDVGLSFNFTSRDRRPSYRQLDGSIQYLNRYTYQAGNPSLLPVKIYTAQIMAQWQFLFAQGLYTYEKNSIFYTTKCYNDDPFIKIVIFENIPKYHSFQFAIGAQPKFGCWSPTATLGIFCNFYKASFIGREKNFNKPYIFLNWTNAISLPNEWHIDIDLMAKSSGYQQNSYLKTSSYINIGVRKAIFDKNFTVGLTANDIFNKNNSRITTYNGDIKINTNNYQESRNIVLTLQYNLNASRSKYKGTGAGINEKRRL
jgi:hypothetical protein